MVSQCLQPQQPFELFQAGISMYPEGDNWSIVKLLEKMADTKVEWKTIINIKNKE